MNEHLIPIRSGVTVVRGGDPLSPVRRAELARRLAELARARARAAVDCRTYVITGGTS